MSHLLRVQMAASISRNAKLMFPARITDKVRVKVPLKMQHKASQTVSYAVVNFRTDFRTILMVVIAVVVPLKEQRFYSFFRKSNPVFCWQNRIGVFIA